MGGLATSCRPDDGLTLSGVSCFGAVTTGNAALFPGAADFDSAEIAVPQPVPSSDEEEGKTYSIPGLESGLSAEWMEDAFSEPEPVCEQPQVQGFDDEVFDALLSQLQAGATVQVAKAAEVPLPVTAVPLGTNLLAQAFVATTVPSVSDAKEYESCRFDRLMDDSLRRVRQRTMPTFPWENGPVSWILGNGGGTELWQGLGSVQHLSVSGFVPERPAPPVDVIKHDIPRVFWSAVRSRTAGLDFSAQQDYERRKALIRWKLIIYETMEHCSSGTLLAQSVMAGEEAIQCFLEDLFAGKATQTMNKRASSILRFLKWASQRGFVVLPLQESSVYGYMTWLKTEGAPTTGQSFVEALRFCHGVIGLHGVMTVLESRRIVGSARLMFERKPPPRQRDPLTVEQLKVLESLSATAETLQDRIMAGSLCFMIHARLRASDMARASMLEFDLVREGGFVEAKAMGTKTANTANKKTRQLPVVAPVVPLGDVNWAEAWRDARAEARFDDSFPLMPAPLFDGGWSRRPLTSAEIGRWLCSLLTAEKCMEADAYIGSHSCKATILSFLAKFGVEATVRRFLGYHVAPGDKSMLAYSRDAAAGPLRVQAEMMGHIVVGLFNPNETRSGTLKSVAPGPPVAPFVDPNTPAGEKQTSESDSESSSSDESGTDEVSEIERLGISLAPQILQLVEAECSDLRVYKHKYFGTSHLCSKDSERLLCGRLVNGNYCIEARLSLDWSRCNQCFEGVRIKKCLQA